MGDEAALSVRSMSKTFGRTTVLRHADLSLSAGRVRGLLGQNGSGKSTLIKILAGYHAPDPGAVLRVRGTDVSLPAQPETLFSLGVGFMHQDLALEESMNVVENYLVGQGGALSPVRWRTRTREVAAELADVGLDVDVHQPVSRLTAGQRSVLAMARAVRHVRDRRGVLILDEPTASMDRDGVVLLFRAVSRLTAQGVAILFVGHNLGEALALCDDITVLRDGVVVADAAASEFDEESLVRTIVGRDIGQLYPVGQNRPEDEVVLTVDGLTGDVVRDFSVRLHRGEVVGVTGLAGMGHDEVPELIFGQHPPRGGSVHALGRRLRGDPAECLAAGVVFVPGDRKRMGVHSGASVQENVSLPVARRFVRRGVLRRRAVRTEVRAMLDAFDVRPRSPDTQMGLLSGGNQQRAIIGKWLRLFPGTTVLLLAEPVHGVDIAARQAIFEHIRAAVDRGIAVLLVSSEHDDLAHLCDRVLVLRRGRIAVELAGGRIAAHDITAACMRTSTHGE